MRTNRKHNLPAGPPVPRLPISCLLQAADLFRLRGFLTPEGYWLREIMLCRGSNAVKDYSESLVYTVFEEAAEQPKGSVISFFPESQVYCIWKVPCTTVLQGWKELLGPQVTISEIIPRITDLLDWKELPGLQIIIAGKVFLCN